MSNLWFNIRFGARHFQVSRAAGVSFHINPYWIENPPNKWFVVYCIFGKHL